MSSVVVVTGASGGIGRACAVAFAERGAAIVLIARGEQGLQGAADDVRRHGGTPFVLPVDVSDADAVEAAVDRVENEIGPISVWVNTAFTSVFAPFWKMTTDEFRRATEVSYLGFVYGTWSVLRRMMERDRGTIIQVGSALAYRSIPLQSAYCGAKHGIRGFHESLRVELLHQKSNVNVTMVHMPGVNTPQFRWVLSRMPDKAQPVPPIYQPEIAAEAVMFAADHPRQREYWVGSSTVGTILGNKIAPALLDHYLAITGFKSQQTKEPSDPDAPVNLWEPADGTDGKDFGSHGVFDQRAKTRAPQLWLAHHKYKLAAAATAAVAAGVAGIIRRAAR
ncbi:Short-chain dehydrogenase [Microlunatus soli]|uniref:Short-chain dehydrogenase n=1 Tax=Microlunatus soli TaxID=630515 RepID=A0A1H1N8Z8_9ACTN|nr:Short-chain dehydrogenase [Microlunatus soli]